MFDDPYFVSMRARHVKTLTKTTASKKKQGWRTYERVENIEGKIITAELLRLKKLTAKKHGSLGGEDSKLAYPYDQIIWWTQDLFSELQAISDTVELERSSDGASVGAIAAFAAGFDDMHKEAPGCNNKKNNNKQTTSYTQKIKTQQQQHQQQPNNTTKQNRNTNTNKKKDMQGTETTEARGSMQQMEVPDTPAPTAHDVGTAGSEGGPQIDDGVADGLAGDEAINNGGKNVNRCHAEWDRKLRERNGILRRSRQNSMSANTPVEATFKKLVDDTIKVDAKLLIFESCVSSKQTVSLQDIEDAKQNCIKIANNIKTINKMKQALHGLIELAPAI